MRPQHCALISVLYVLITDPYGDGIAGSIHEHHMNRHSIAADANIQIADDAAAGVLTVRIGPVNLPASTEHRSVSQSPDFLMSIPFQGWLIAYHTRLLNSRGAELPGRLLHHVTFFNMQREDFLRPGEEERIFSAGAELPEWPSLPGWGYKVGKGGKILVKTMFHNPTETHYPDSFVEVQVQYRVQGKDSSLQNIYPAWFCVRDCNRNMYDLNPGRNVDTGEVRMNYPGRLLAVGGHAHDYVQLLSIENLTRKMNIATLHPELDRNGKFLSFPSMQFFDTGGYSVNSGDVIRITAIYDNTSGKPLPNAGMGLVIAGFVPDDEKTFEGLKLPGR